MEYTTARIAAIQPNALCCNSEAVFTKYIDSLTYRASIQGSQIVVFPEDISLWIQWAKEDIKAANITNYKAKEFVALAESREYRPGFAGLIEKSMDNILSKINLHHLGAWLSQERISRIMDRSFSSAAKKHNVVIVGGTRYVWQNKNLVNLCRVYDRDGSIAGETTKHHLVSIESAMGISCDDWIKPISTKDFTLGICICYDLNFPQVPEILALCGAQIICCPSSGIRPYPNFPFTEQYDMPQIRRAQETGLSIVRAYMCGWMSPGLYFDGHTSVVDPSGNIIAKSTHVSESEIIVCDVPIRKRQSIYTDSKSTIDY